MKNISMFIRGAIGIYKGLGRDEIFFDLSGKTGLIALAGPNGKGKTTFLELMSLYRTLASRKGSLKHHFRLRDSRVEHKFMYDGDEYHLIWKIDSGSDKSEAFIIINGESVVNGKNTEYDKYIVEKFGSQTLFYNSVFCAQGSGNMSTMTTGKIKELFVEFLRIERLAVWEKECKQGVAYFQKKLDILSGKIETCQAELLTFENLDKEIKHSELTISSKVLYLKDADKEIKQLDKTINDLNAKSEKQKTDITRKEELETELEKLKHDRDQIQEKINLETKTFNEKKAAFDKEMEPVDIILADKEKILKASSRIKNLERWERYFSNCFECSIDEQAMIDKDIKDVESRKESLNNQITGLENDLILDGLKTMLNYLVKRKFDFDSNDSILKSKLKSAENDFSLMQATQNVKACKEKIAIAIDPDCKSTTCPAIGIVALAKNELPGLEKLESVRKKEVNSSIKDIKTAITLCTANLIDIESKTRHCMMDHEGVSKSITSAILEFQKKIDVLDLSKKELLSWYLDLDDIKGFYKSALADKRALISNLEELSSKKSQIEVAEEKKKSIKKQTEQLVKDYSNRKVDLEKTKYKLMMSFSKIKESISKIEDGIDDTIANQIINCGTNKADSVIKQANIVKNLDELKEDAAVLKNNKARKETISKDLLSKQSDEKTFKKELSEWYYLQLACSKTGLQALEIDGAAPLITAEANILLDKAFGLESQIKIITQDPETGKEVFWIKVIREDGSEDDFSNLSGGQKVWISEALSKGMTLVSKRKSGRNFESLFADESDGALDSEKAIDFMKMKRATMDAGGFVQYLFISHNPDVVAMADHVIDFGAL